jgi:hypothetical protein
MTNINPIKAISLVVSLDIKNVRFKGLQTSISIKKVIAEKKPGKV